MVETLQTTESLKLWYWRGQNPTRFVKDTKWRGYRTQHVLWRIQNGEAPSCLKAVVIHCGTNNLDRDSPTNFKVGV